MRIFFSRPGLLFALTLLTTLSAELLEHRLQLWCGFAAGLTLGLIGAHFGARLIELHLSGNLGVPGDIWLPVSKSFLIKLALLCVFAGGFLACWGPDAVLALASFSVTYLVFLGCVTWDVYRAMTVQLVSQSGEKSKDGRRT